MKPTHFQTFRDMLEFVTTYDYTVCFHNAKVLTLEMSTLTLGQHKFKIAPRKLKYSVI